MVTRFIAQTIYLCIYISHVIYTSRQLYNYSQLQPLINLKKTKRITSRRHSQSLTLKMVEKNFFKMDNVNVFWKLRETFKVSSIRCAHLKKINTIDIVERISLVCISTLVNCRVSQFQLSIILTVGCLFSLVELSQTLVEFVRYSFGHVSMSCSCYCKSKKYLVSTKTIV